MEILIHNFNIKRKEIKTKSPIIIKLITKEIQYRKNTLSDMITSLGLIVLWLAAFTFGYTIGKMD